MSDVAQMDMIEEALRHLEEADPDPLGPERTIRESFARFHERNPHVYTKLLSIAREAQERGYKTWAIDAAFHVLRWSDEETFGDAFKLNNNYRALYARLLMHRNPDLQGFFRIRRMRAA